MYMLLRRKEYSLEESAIDEFQLNFQELSKTRTEIRNVGCMHRARCHDPTAVAALRTGFLPLNHHCDGTSGDSGGR